MNNQTTIKITIDKAQKIIDLFTNMNSKKDFLTLLNISKNFIYKENTLPFTEKQLNYYLIKDSKKFNSKRKSYTADPKKSQPNSYKWQGN